MKKLFKEYVKIRAQNSEFTGTQPTTDEAGHQANPASNETAPKMPVPNESASILDSTNVTQASGVSSRIEDPAESSLSGHSNLVSMDSNQANILSLAPQLNQVLSLVQTQNAFTSKGINVMKCMDGLLKSLCQIQNQSTNNQNFLNLSKTSEAKKCSERDNLNVSDEEMPNALPAEKSLNYEENVATAVCSVSLQNKNADDIATTTSMASSSYTVSEHPDTKRTYTPSINTAVGDLQQKQSTENKAPLTPKDDETRVKNIIEKHSNSFDNKENQKNAQKLDVAPVCSGDQRKLIEAVCSERNGFRSADLKENVARNHDNSTTKIHSCNSTLRNNTSAPNSSAQVTVIKNNTTENICDSKIKIIDVQYITRNHNSNQNEQNVSAKKITTECRSVNPADLYESGKGNGTTKVPHRSVILNDMTESQGVNVTTKVLSTSVLPINRSGNKLGATESHQDSNSITVLSRAVKSPEVKEIDKDDDCRNKSKPENPKNTTKAHKRVITTSQMKKIEQEFSKSFRDVIEDIKETFKGSNAILGHIYTTNLKTAETFDEFLNITENFQQSPDDQQCRKKALIIEDQGKENQSGDDLYTNISKQEANHKNTIEPSPKKLPIKQTTEKQKYDELNRNVIPKRKISSSQDRNSIDSPKILPVNQESVANKQQADDKQKTDRNPKTQHQNSSKCQQSNDKNTIKMSHEKLTINRESVEPKQKTKYEHKSETNSENKNEDSKPKHESSMKIKFKRKSDIERGSDHYHKRRPEYYIDRDDSNSSDSTEFEQAGPSKPKRPKIVRNENKIILGTKTPPTQENNTKSTLRHECNETGLVELTNGSNVFVRRTKLRESLSKSNDCMTLTALLMKEVFTDDALNEFKVTSKNLAYKGSVLDNWAVIVLLDYVRNAGKRMGWKDVDLVRFP